MKEILFLSMLFSPLLGFVINTFLFKKKEKEISGVIGTSVCFFSFFSLLSLLLINGFSSLDIDLFTWLKAGDFKVSFLFSLDSLNLLLALLVTGVGSLIHLFSLDYMKGDTGLARYFSYLGLFIFMMLVLIFAGNLPVLFLGWEGVGLCSYLLIGFFFKEEKKVDAGLLAFVVNRIADACMLAGMFFVFKLFGSLDFHDISSFIKTKTFDLNEGRLACFLLFLGAIGKSAQIPFYFWLPKAMAGPTPVSALIHAATMVTAGIYLIVRLSPLYSFFPHLLNLIALIGAITAFLSALVACRQWDLKKVLAYSTVSQLAYLFIAVGIKAYSASIFHLLTHGFFKALLFLCAGAIIHALKEQDIRKMGNLRQKMPLIFFCFLSGTLALMAIPPFSGFFSKDEILFSLLSSKNYLLFFISFFTGLITIFYMTRLLFLVFFGEDNFKKPVHGAGMRTKLPLVVLSFLSLFGGLMGLPHLLSKILPLHPPHMLHLLLKDFTLKINVNLFLEGFLMVFSSLVGLLVFFISFKAFSLKTFFPIPSFIKKTLEEGFFVEEKLVLPVRKMFSDICSNFFTLLEEGFFFGIPRFILNQTMKLRSQILFFQNGNLQSYAWYFTLGLTVLTLLVFMR